MTSQHFVGYYQVSINLCTIFFQQRVDCVQLVWYFNGIQKRREGEPNKLIIKDLLKPKEMLI